MSGARGPLALLVHPSSQLYGSDRMALETVVGLRAAGWRVLAVLPDRGPLGDRLREAGAECATSPMAVLRKSVRTPRGALTLLRDVLRTALPGWRLLRSRRPSVVLVSTVTLPLWPLLARLASVPVVSHVHEAESQLPAPLRLALAAPLLLSTRVIANSSHTRAQLLASAPALAGRTTVVLNGVPHVPVAADQALHPDRGHERSLRLLYVGRISDRKGVGVLLDALEEVRRRGARVHLDLVGDAFAGDPDARAVGEALVARAEGPGLAGAVTWHGFSDAVHAHLAACDALVVPAVLPESFGNTAVEGALAARPVVASAVGALPEVLAGIAGSRLVPPGDVRALADALLALSAELPERRAQARAGARDAARRYDVGRYRREVVAVVEGTARATPRPRAVGVEASVERLR